ncbi:hypothetical protein K2173_018136 [Erythroxylum novogranatense]|uniref:Uncharacterized protein n=1 Tax=Erythroxylum novogranatense TaxID=1862640 RepID=A0AAV8U6D0_9ROSI|nr:hypothetical protein K2173_018136 [Erythroxylum novogranatense]
MDASDICPTEDAIAALLDYLVDPKLLQRYSAKDIPSQLDQESVSKQVYAVVLLYNYYYRKQHLKLEYLSFENFCKLAVILRPTLLAHMRFMRSNDTELNDPEKQLSLTEKHIMNACEVSKVLDASENIPKTVGWPVSKVAVFLVDSKKENCLLQFGSITYGIWSVIERDVGFSTNISKPVNDVEHVDKKRRIIKRTARCELSTDETGLNELACFAIKETTGINESDLVLLESHTVYSVSKEKAATRFYIIQCIEPNNNHAIQVPVNRAIISLQGPMFLKSTRRWTHTSVVEYSHLLPYAGILSDWLSKKGLSSYLEIPRVELVTTNLSSPGKRENPSHVNASIMVSTGGAGLSKHSGNTGHSENEADASLHSPKQNDNIGPGCTDKDLHSKEQDPNCMVDSSSGLGRSSSVEMKASNVAHTTKEEELTTNASTVQPDNFHQKTSAEKCLEASSSGHEIEMFYSRRSWRISQNKDRDVTIGKKRCNKILSDQGVLPLSDYAADTTNSDDLDKMPTITASNDKEMIQSALRSILSRRDKLSSQRREVEAQIAQCDDSIHKILNGGESNLALMIESSIDHIDSCSQGLKGQCPPHVEVQQDSVAKVLNPCQELDNLCVKKNWILPTYHVSSVDGGFQAKVSLKRMNFELSIDGDVCLRPHEARESAAARVFAEFRIMLSME